MFPLSGIGSFPVSIGLDWLSAVSIGLVLRLNVGEAPSLPVATFARSGRIVSIHAYVPVSVLFE